MGDIESEKSGNLGKKKVGSHKEREVLQCW